MGRAKNRKRIICRELIRANGMSWQLSALMSYITQKQYLITDLCAKCSRKILLGLLTGRYVLCNIKRLCF